MRTGQYKRVVVIVALLIIVSLTSIGMAGAHTENRSITVDRTLMLTPEDPGSITIETKFHIPDIVQEEVRMKVPEGVHVVNYSGVEKRDEIFYWDEQSEHATFRWEFNPNESETLSDGRTFNTFQDPGPSAFIKDRAIKTSIAGGEFIILDFNSTEYHPSGFHFGRQVYLGNYTTFTEGHNGQRFVIYVPEAAPQNHIEAEAIINQLTYASSELAIGGKDEKVIGYMFMEGIYWPGLGGETFSDNEFWALGGPNHSKGIWLHEYIHTRQRFSSNLNKDEKWLTEAQAEYYAHLLLLKGGYVQYPWYKQQLEQGQKYEATVLADESTWEYNSEYEKGAAALASIDRSIRKETEGSHTLIDVFAKLNSDSNNKDFYSLVGDFGGEKSESLARELATSSKDPSVPDIHTHEDIYGWTVAKTSASASNAFIDSPYQETTIRKEYKVENGTFMETTKASVNSSIRFPIELSNEGGKRYSGEIGLKSQDGTILMRNDVQVGPTSTENITIEYRPETTSRKILLFQDDPRNVFAEFGIEVVETEGDAFNPTFSVAGNNITAENRTVTVDISDPMYISLDVGIDNISYSGGGKLFVDGQPIPGERNITYGRYQRDITDEEYGGLYFQESTSGGSVTVRYDFKEYGNHTISWGDPPIAQAQFKVVEPKETQGQDEHGHSKVDLKQYVFTIHSTLNDMPQRIHLFIVVGVISLMITGFAVRKIRR